IEENLLEQGSFARPRRPENMRMLKADFFGNGLGLQRLLPFPLLLLGLPPLTVLCLALFLFTLVALGLALGLIRFPLGFAAVSFALTLGFFLLAFAIAALLFGAFLSFSVFFVHFFLKLHHLFIKGVEVVGILMLTPTLLEKLSFGCVLNPFR